MRGAGCPSGNYFHASNKEYGLSIAGRSTRGAQRRVCILNWLPELETVPEVVEHIFDQHGKNSISGRFSGSTRDSVVCLSHALRLLDRFDALVCAGEYRNSKPHPEAFLACRGEIGRSSKRLPRF